MIGRRPAWIGLFVMSVSVCYLLGAVAMGGEQIDAEAYRPVWKVGQQWIVEIVSLQLQVRHDLPPAQPSTKVRWRFAVRSIDTVDGRECFRVEIKCLASQSPEPETVMWVDQQTMTLRKVQTRLAIAGGSRTITESYHAPSGQPFPALAPLTVPPIELPLFLSGAKGTQTFTYEATSGPEGIKGVGDIGFTFAVEQQLASPDADEIKGLLPEDYTKGIQQKPTVEVRLNTPRTKVRQLWQRGYPWPLYSSNGVASARLIEVTELDGDSQP
jgi:hypothetical protein